MTMQHREPVKKLDIYDYLLIALGVSLPIALVVPVVGLISLGILLVAMFVTSPT